MVTARELRLPLSEADARSLKAGDMVSLVGDIITGRDRVHRFLAEDRPSPKDIPFPIEGSVLYHCGPIVRKSDDEYQVLSAGPTTSMRVEIYAPAVIREYKIRGIMGKGGMGEKTREALKEAGCVYLHAVGGAAVYLARKITGVRGVWKLGEFGTTEAMWLFHVEGFPAIVTMDANGNDLHREIEEYSSGKLSGLLRTVQP